MEFGEHRGHLPSGLHAGPQLSDDSVVLLMSWAVAVGGRIHGRHRKTAFGHEAAGTRHDAGSVLVLAATMPHEDQGPGSVGSFRRPQHTGDLAECAAEGEELFDDALRRRP
jgi:hypothetical protein